VERALRDSQILNELLAANNWDANDAYQPQQHQRILVGATGLSSEAQKKLVSARFLTVLNAREQRGDPYKLKYVVKRASSVDWSLLDLFYQLCLFENWSTMFDAAERSADPDEGPVANLGLLTDYLARFMEQRAPIISGDLLDDGLLSRLFFSSYLYSLHRRGESEFEDAEDPFPKGRIPFLTVHQAKGLEFPVVVLGNPRKDLKGPQAIERIGRGLFGDSDDKEPLSKVDLFDVMRMFYVALSRAQNLLILAQYSGRGQSTFERFRTLLPGLPTLSAFDITSVPVADLAKDEAPRIYSYTGDYLAYLRCPRQYMVFRKFDFVPSRSQTMIFGTLVHRTLDDLHNHLIAQRAIT
jgi:DNA helicase-2/ATP-dependent DNA helicase PcrA